MATHFSPIEQSFGTFVIAIADIIIADTPWKPIPHRQLIIFEGCCRSGGRCWEGRGTGLVWDRLKELYFLWLFLGSRVDLLANMSKRLTHKVAGIRSCGSQGSRCPLSGCQNFYACLALFALFFWLCFSAFFSGHCCPAWCCLVLALYIYIFFFFRRRSQRILFRFVKCAARVNI